MAKKRRVFVLLLLVIVLAACAFTAGQLLGATKTNTPTPNTKNTPQTSSAANKLVFAAMGDMLAHDSVVAQAKTGDTYDFTPYFTSIRPLYHTADAVFCNAETLAAGEKLGISGYPTFNAPSEFARDLVKGAGCNVISLANNHMNDKRQAGIDANLDVWDKLPILAHSGSNRSEDDRNEISYFSKNGIKVAFLAYTIATTPT